MPVNINGTTGIDTPGVASDTMPTSGGDAVVESGSNSDGYWTRFADGTQRTHASSIGTSSGSWTYPMGFLEVPTVVATAESAFDRYANVSTTRTNVACAIRSYQSGGTSSAASATAIAEGRWK